MKSRRERLHMLHERQLYLYRAYLAGQIDKEEYLLTLYPVDCAIDRLEISFLYTQMKQLCEEKKKE